MPTKKRKNTKRRQKPEPKPEHELPGGFWRQVSAVLMIAVALFFVMTWFGHGGTILNEVHKFLLSGLGLATYFLPVLLVYLAVKIFRSEDNRVALPVYFASLLMLLWISGIAAISKNGGIIGDWLNKLMLNVLDQGTVIFIYIVLILITTAFVLQLSPVTFFKGTKNLLKPGKKSEQNPESPKKSKKGSLEIKVNSGLVASEPEPATKKLLHKTPAASAPEPVKEEKALVSVSDPDWKMPTTDLLEKKQSPADAGNIQQNAYIIKSTLAEFGIDVEMEGANVGPVEKYF